MFLVRQRFWLAGCSFYHHIVAHNPDLSKVLQYYLDIIVGISQMNANKVLSSGYYTRWNNGKLNIYT